MVYILRIALNKYQRVRKLQCLNAVQNKKLFYKLLNMLVSFAEMSNFLFSNENNNTGC